MWAATTNFPTAASHPFYTRLNQRLAEHYFDDFVEGQCQPFYAEIMGRPGLPPGMYFRLLLIGYFEGIDSERGIAWREGPQSWIDLEAERDAVYANRRRIRGDRGQRLLRKRGELLERPSAHLYETGGFRRVHVRGHQNVLKPLLVHASAFNLGLCMRTLFGIGTPRGLQGRLAAVGGMLSTLWSLVCKTIPPIGSQTDRPTPSLAAMCYFSDSPSSHAEASQ